MRDAEEEIREIKREIIESRGLIIKTNNLTNALAADIKSIATRQAGYESRSKWNSAIAYLLFATLAFVGLKLASDARIAEIDTEKTELRRQVQQLRRELDEQTRREARREAAEEEAARFYELVRQQKRAEVVEGFEALQGQSLSPAEVAFLRDTVDRFRLDLSVEAYQNGLDLARTGRFAEAAEKFQEAIEQREEAPHIPAVKLNLAMALRRLNRHAEAIVLAQAVSEQQLDRELQDDAVWLIGECAEEAGNLDEARNAMRTILRRWPRSALATDARKRLGELNVRVLRGGTR